MIEEIQNKNMIGFTRARPLYTRHSPRRRTHNTQYRNAGPLTPRARHTCTVYAVPYGDWVDLFHGGWLARTATKRSVVHNANPGIAPPPCAWSIEMGQCSGTRPPPGAVCPSRKRDQEAARSNRRASPVSVRVPSQWCTQEAADQAARTPWPPGRQHGRGPS
jgi:hypothetical protein